MIALYLHRSKPPSFSSFTILCSLFCLLLYSFVCFLFLLHYLLSSFAVLNFYFSLYSSFSLFSLFSILLHIESSSSLRLSSFLPRHFTFPSIPLTLFVIPCLLRFPHLFPASLRSYTYSCPSLFFFHSLPAPIRCGSQNKGITSPKMLLPLLRTAVACHK